LDNLLLRDLGIDRAVEESTRAQDCQLCQPIHPSSLQMDGRRHRRARTCQVCEYEERGEVQSSVNICLAHSARLCTKTHPSVEEVGLARVDNAGPVTDYSWLCPNTEWSCWNKFHQYYVKEGLWLDRPAVVDRETNSIKFGRRQTSSRLNKLKNEALGIDDW
jgi:hypothetical protein